MTLVKNKLCNHEKRITILENQEVNVAATITKCPIYEYRVIQMEEGGAIDSNSAEWSVGNGATGFTGIAVPEGFEVYEMSFQADNHSVNANVTVDFVSRPTGSAGNTISSINLVNASDGGGTTNHSWKVEDFSSSPIAVPQGVVGFQTRQVIGGTVSDARVVANIRRQVNEVVCDIQFTDAQPTIEDFGNITISNTERPNSGWDNQPISGMQAFDADVSFCFTVDLSTTNTATMLGLNTDPNLDANWNSIDFAAYILHVGTNPQLRVYESGTFQAGAGIVNLNIGDEICVSRVGTTVTYSVNGSVVFTSLSSSIGDLFVDSSAFGNASYSGNLNLTGVIAQ